jgi:adenine-specific DNA glycosylase
VYVAAAVARRAERALLVRRRSGYLAGLWEFPCGEGGSEEAARLALLRRCRELWLRVEAGRGEPASHAIVGRRLRIRVFAAAPRERSGRREEAPAVRWLTAGQADRAALPTLTKKIARTAGFLRRGVP